MSARTLQDGIDAVAAGKMKEGARLLRYALKDNSLTGKLRAVGFLWLAETQSNYQFKLHCHQLALEADPTNPTVSERLSALLTQRLPGNDTPSQGMRPVDPGMGGQPPAQNAPHAMWSNRTGNTPSQGIPPVNPPPIPSSGGGTPPQGMRPINLPSQPSQPNQPDQGYNQGQPANPNWQYGGTPPQGMRPINLPNQSNQPNQYNQGGEQGWPYTTGNTPSQAVPPANPNQPLQLQGPERSVGIFDGPNGSGTGFFITRNGLIATTRYVVGGANRVTVQLLDGRLMTGQVVRSMPEYDLAFVLVNAQLNQLLPITNTPTIAENAQIWAYAHPNGALRTVRRPTRHAVPGHWFPTMVSQMMDAGGNPVFDSRNLLVGMLTRNAGRSTGYMYGLHITMIYRLGEQYDQERRQAGSMQIVYCQHCGKLSRAIAYNAFYCEHCGTLLPYAEDLTRVPQPHTIGLYGENMVPACQNPQCRAQVGYYEGRCLRCGHENQM